MENIVNDRGGLPVTMDDWFDWLRDEVVGIGMTAGEEEVIRSNLELIVQRFDVCCIRRIELINDGYVRFVIEKEF
jgi:hypothetical protein